MIAIDDLRQQFTARFSSVPRIYRAPGRVNIIGEHTDYNMGFVLPAAIDKAAWMAIAPAEDARSHWVSADFNDECYADLDVVERSSHHWANYILGVVKQFQELGHAVPAFNALIMADVPIGSGLSSSAALQSVVAWALNDWLGLEYGRKELALLVQRAENQFIGLQCGIMDMFASLNGKKGHALRLDCQSLDYELFPLDLLGHKIVLLDTGVKHSLANTEYNTRRNECEAGVRIISKARAGVESLRDVDLQELFSHQHEFDPVIFRRCRFVIEENDRVLRTCEAMRQGDLSRVGELMKGSHRGLRDDYEVSCRELDLLSTLADEEPTILGSRMMGGGFGGCTINLVQENGLDQLLFRIKQAYQEATGIVLKHYTVVTDDGASKS